MCLIDGDTYVRLAFSFSHFEDNSLVGACIISGVYLLGIRKSLNRCTTKTS